MLEDCENVFFSLQKRTESRFFSDETKLNLVLFDRKLVDGEYGAQINEKYIKKPKKYYGSCIFFWGSLVFMVKVTFKN